jgi:hypothetical protein
MGIQAIGPKPDTSKPVKGAYNLPLPSKQVNLRYVILTKVASLSVMLLRLSLTGIILKSVWMVKVDLNQRLTWGPAIDTIFIGRYGIALNMNIFEQPPNL